ncbi:MAG: CRISPR-associated protein Cas4 [Anaerococcus sp.]|uniref:CRISPR-associated protein Cas4 n=1 Tax=Anaerococcus sp. TaxID=1872515 RepID=UPI0029158F63|nr:CRISPR-associated protein Cas4 [Anaerococcus sp.]MDU4026663.1 CRISPR-associated protein Cas4 [Anaerococcus sp.]MDU7412339.1 CRISPR-associated protein Cas4 [Anaerococcus sp.]
MSAPDDYLMLSGIQHFYFCKRQWALIHIEQVWSDNSFTAEGNELHEITDDPYLKEKRKNIIISRAIPVSSKDLGLSGILDTVEFIKSDKGIEIANKKGLWMPNVVEYKRGKAKKDNRDAVQVAAQVMCLEEKYNIQIESADLFYFSTKKRETIAITNQLKDEVRIMANQMHTMYENKLTPDAEYFKNCTMCSLYDLCMPRLTKKKKSVQNYLLGE